MAKRTTSRLADARQLLEQKIAAEKNDNSSNPVSPTADDSNKQTLQTDSKAAPETSKQTQEPKSEAAPETSKQTQEPKSKAAPKRRTRKQHTQATTQAEPQPYSADDLFVIKHKERQTFEDVHKRATFWYKREMLDQLDDFSKKTGLSKAEIMDRALRIFMANAQITKD